MKKIMFMLALLANSLFAGKTNWSKVGLYYTNVCNKYTFELSGIDTTCMSYRYVEIVNSSAQVFLRQQNGSRVYNVTFPAKGKYYATVLVMNKCNGDDTLFVDTIDVTCFPSCDFSKVTLKQWNQGTYYKWQLSGWDKDSCKGYMFLVYDFQNKKTDTVPDIRGIVEVNFNRPGEYKLYVKLWDKCKKCDTALSRPVKIVAWKPTAKVSFIKKTCDSMWFEMPSMNMKDTCWTNYYYVYGGPELDSLTDKEWLTMSDADLYWYYSFDDKDLLANPETRILKYKFPKDGKYLVIGQYYNKCLNQDTVIFTRHTINCKTTVNTIYTQLPSAKVIATYDVLGRPVTEMKEGQVYIEVLNNGSRRKVVKK